MVRVVTQETFDEIVKENMDELSMTPEEAIEDAVQQFEAQGVDLSNIVRDLIMISMPGGEYQALKDAIDNIEKLIETNCASPELSQQLVHLKEICDKSLGHKIMASKYGAYSQILKVLEVFEDHKDMVNPALDALISLMTGNPDLLDEKGTTLMLHYLNTQSDVETLQLVLRWTRQCCIKHEKNRQDIFSRHILDRLKKLLDSESTPASLIRDVCAVVHTLVLDDDVRVEFGNAHEHARVMASETLLTITALLKKFQDDKSTVTDVLSTLAALIVRNEFCENVADAGGLKFILDTLVNFPNNEKLNCQCFKLFKVLAGNDRVKTDIIKGGAAPLIISAMNQHRSSANLARAGGALLAALSLRSPENSRTLCEAGAAEAIVEAMSIHHSDGDVQCQCCWAVRNIVSRDRSLCPQFLSLDVEALLRKALETHRDKCDHDARAALRDLGCAVQLREAWTGKGGMLNHR